MQNEKQIDDKYIKRIEMQRNRNRALFKCAVNWIEVFVNGSCIAEYFEKRGYNRIAIYGVSDLGKLLCKALENKDIKIEYFVDQAADLNRLCCGVPVYLPEEAPKLQSVDVIVVTPVFYFNDICRTLLMFDPALSIVSLNSVIDECLGEIWYEKQCENAPSFK